MVLKLKDGRKELYQWDVGVVADVTIDNVDEVHFSNLRYGVSFNIKVVDNKVEFPPEVLQSGADVFCWAFVREQNGGYTKKEQTFNVEKRPRPADYVYEPTEILSWEALKKEIEKLDEDTTEALADLEKGTIKELDEVDLITCESGVYLTSKIIYRKATISQPFTEWIPSKALLIVVKDEIIGIHFQCIGASYIFQGLSNAEGEFENEFTKYTFEDYATKEYVNELIGNIESGGSDYTLPVGGDELGGVKNGGNVVINEDGTMTAPESEVTDEQVSSAVSEYLEANPDKVTTVQDGSITQDKLAYVKSKRYMTVPEIVLEYAKPYAGANIQASTDCDIAMYYVKAGTKFLLMVPQRMSNALDFSSYIQIATTRNTLAVGDSNNSGMNNLLGSLLINTWINRFVNNTFSNNVVCVDAERSSIYLQAVTDLYIYFNCIHGKPTENYVAIVEEPDDWLIDFLANNFQVYNVNVGFKGFKELYNIKPDEFKLTKGSFLYDTEIRTIDNADRLKAIPRTIGKNELFIKWIGDSICYAGSNAGLENAYRHIVTTCLDAVQNSTTVAGVCYTDGYGTGWDSVASGSAYTGYNGLKHYLEQEELSVPELTNLVIIAQGTNDFGNNVPLGTIGADDTDTTKFVGAVNQTFNYVEERYPNATVVVLLPFKRKDWTVANEAGHFLTDYMQVIKQLAMTRKHFYVLDLFDKWYVDFDSKGRNFFIDNVHPNGYAHKSISGDMIDFIKVVMSVEGIYYGYDKR